MKFSIAKGSLIAYFQLWLMYEIVFQTVQKVTTSQKFTWHSPSAAEILFFLLLRPKN